MWVGSVVLRHDIRDYVRGVMGRPTNQKCWACSLLTIAEARRLHDGASDGDGCWNDMTCPSRRSYYRKGRGRLAQRQGAI